MRNYGQTSARQTEKDISRAKDIGREKRERERDD
eukprot:COSAG02_NODE_2881_length_7824_cov_3.474822_8_plen_34_part_00